MTRFFLKIYDMMNRRRWLPFAVTAFSMLLFVMLALRIDYKEDISAFLPSDPHSKEYTTVYTRLGGQDRIAVIFRGDTTKLIPAMDYFGETLLETDTAGMVRNLQVTVDEEQMAEVMEYIWNAYPILLSDKDFRQLDTLLTSEGYIARQMEENRRMLMLPFTSVITQSLPTDPLHLSTPVMRRIQNNGISDHYRIIDGHIFSKDGKNGIILLSSPFGISESRQNEKLHDCLLSVSDSVVNHFPEVTVSSIGAPIIAVGNASQIKADSFLAVSLSILLIFAVLYYSFRRWSDIGWIGLSIVFGWLAALGCMALFNTSISIIVLGVGSVIIGIAVNYPLHFLDHLKHEPDRRSALKEMIPPLLIGNITTVSAFLCLVFIEADAMRDLGFFGSLMLIATIAFVLMLLPSMASGRNKGGKTHTLIPEIKVKTPEWMRRITLPVVVIITAVLGYFSLNTSFDSDMQHINYMTDEQRQDLKLLFSSIEASDTTTMVYAVSNGKSADDALAQNEKLQHLLSAHPDILGISGLGNLVPSSSMTEERVGRWNAFWQEHPELLSTLKEECEDKGFNPDACAPFFELCNGDVAVDTSNNPLLDAVGSNFILHDDNGTVRVVNMLRIEKGKAEDVKQALRESIGDSNIDAFVFDSSDVSNNLVSVLSDSFNYIGFVCGFVVFAFLWLSFGRIELTLIAFLPLAVSWLWILGIMDIFAIQFNIVNIILATFIFGQGDDYSIFITEGLTYEYAYGKPRLKTYKDSVALSAVLMFIGIGSLILAKHPALFSLAEVAIIGMFTVVVMTFYLPPLIFRWVTTKNGVKREVPITMKRFIYSLWALLFFLVASLLLFVPYALVHRYFLSRSKRCRQFFHEVLQSVARFVIYRVPGVKFRYINSVGEDFNKPAVIICNHQSHLDVMCLLMMSPKIVMLTNDWVWHNPYYGQIIRAAEFYPISNGLDNNLQQLKSLVERGYSVIVFPEGTRERGRSIMHFHKGAFALAKNLGIDILPVMIHGLVDVLPKRDFMLREGSMTMEVHRRMKADELAKYGDKQLTSYWHAWYVKQYQEMSSRIETLDYWIPAVKYKYAYKGTGVERRCAKTLKACSRNHDIIKGYIGEDGNITIPQSGQGEVAWIASLMYPDREVFAYEEDSDLHAIAVNTQGKPDNLHFINSKV